MQLSVGCERLVIFYYPSDHPYAYCHAFFSLHTKLFSSLKKKVLSHLKIYITKKKLLSPDILWFYVSSLENWFMIRTQCRDWMIRILMSVALIYICNQENLCNLYPIMSIWMRWQESNTSLSWLLTWFYTLYWCNAFS